MKNQEVTKMSMYQSLHRVSGLTIKDARPVSENFWAVRLEIEFGSYGPDHLGDRLEMTLYSDDLLKIDIGEGVQLGS
jgi:hypothetical protein